MVNEETLPLTLLKAENLDFLCLQLTMAVVHVVHLSIQQLAACISSLLKKEGEKKKTKHYAFNSGYHGGLCCDLQVPCSSVT